MFGFVFRRVVTMSVTLIIVSILAFLTPYLAGGDPTRTILRARMGDGTLDSAALEAMRVQLGLDQSPVAQYFSWARLALSGDFGTSFTSRLPVLDLVVPALGVSVALALVSLILAVVLAVPAGIYAATQRGKRIDSTLMLFGQGLVALPVYWVGPVFVLIFAVWLRVLPSAGWGSPAQMVLPALALALQPFAYLFNVTRSAMIDVLNAPYMTSARARGLSRMEAIRRHGVKNAAIPVMTIFSIWLSAMLGGSVVVEVIFAIPGLGRLMYQAIVNADVPIIQAGVVATVGLAVLINTVTDLAYAALNPQIVLEDGR